jgi:hypothetical protein
MEWLCDTRLTPSERSQLLGSLARDWTSEIAYENARGILIKAEEVAAMSDEEKAGTRAVRFAEMWLLFDQHRGKVADVDMLIKAYTRRHKIIAPGRPPLPDEIADAKARYVQFMAREGSGGQVELPLEALRTQLVKTYSTLSAADQKETVDALGDWAKVQYQWSRLSEDRRQAYREAWRAQVVQMFPQLAAQSADARSSGPAAQAPVSAQRSGGYDPAKFAEAQRKLQIERMRTQMIRDGMTQMHATRLNTINNMPGGTYSYWGVR